VVERLNEQKEGSQWEEFFSWIPGPIVNKKSPLGKKPCDTPVCRKVFIRHSVLNVPVTVHTGCKHEYQEYGKKLYKYKEYGKAISYPKNFLGHEQTHTGERPYEYYPHGKAFRSYANTCKK
jgi:hypothetical protein